MSGNSGQNASQKQERIDVIIGVPICRRSSFVLDLFLANQEEIHRAYPDCKLVLATEETDFAEELKSLVSRYKIKAEIITYEVKKPDYSKSSIFNITSGREALRLYTLPANSDYLLFLDADMTYQPDIISILKDKSAEYDVVWSGYRTRFGWEWGFGGGCLMLRQWLLPRINFRCYEFPNGEIIYEDEILDMDAFRNHMKTRKGIFVHIQHYIDRNHYISIAPQSTGWLRAVYNSLIIRYILLKASITTRYNIPRRLHYWITLRRRYKKYEDTPG